MATLRLENRSELPRTLEIRDLAYGQPSRRTSLAPRQARGLSLKLEKSHGWYDIGIEASGMSLRMAGHVENGEASYSDPAAYGAATMRSKTR